MHPPAARSGKGAINRDFEDQSCLLQRSSACWRRNGTRTRNNLSVRAGDEDVVRQSAAKARSRLQQVTSLQEGAGGRNFAFAFDPQIDREVECTDLRVAIPQYKKAA